MVKIVDHGTWPLRHEDEGSHPAGVEPLWSESVYLDFTAEDGSIAGYVRLGLYPNWNRAWYWACLVGKDRPLVLLADNHAPLPLGAVPVRDGGRPLGLRLDGMASAARVAAARVVLITFWRAVPGIPSLRWGDCVVLMVRT